MSLSQLILTLMCFSFGPFFFLFYTPIRAIHFVCPLHPFLSLSPLYTTAIAFFPSLFYTLLLAMYADAITLLTYFLFYFVNSPATHLLCEYRHSLALLYGRRRRSLAFLCAFCVLLYTHFPSLSHTETPSLMRMRKGPLYADVQRVSCL